MAMKVEYINPFISAAKHVLNLSCQEEVEIGSLSLRTTPILVEDVVIILGVTGDIEGQVIFSMTEQAAMQIASKMMMGMEVLTLDTMSKSAICELTNMILGNTATSYSESGITVDITPPSLLIGKDIAVTTIKGDFVDVPLQFKSSGVTFDINICVVDSEKEK